jgi:hypothetical protein
MVRCRFYPNRDDNKYGTSCRTVSSTTQSDRYITTTDDSTPPTTPTTTPTTTSTIFTTSYSTFTGTSLVSSDGTTFTSYYTSISSVIPVSSSPNGRYTTSTTSADPLQTNQANTSAPGNNTAAIVGGTLGGIAALGLLALLTWHMM